MKYPKELMSITELTKLGYPRHTLAQWARAKNAPVVYTVGKGKALFITSKLEDFIRKIQ